MHAVEMGGLLIACAILQAIGLGVMWPRTLHAENAFPFFACAGWLVTIVFMVVAALRIMGIHLI